MPADTHDGAVVSSDHAGEDSSVEHLAASSGPRTIAPDEVREHNGKSGSSFWAVVDGFVVEHRTFLRGTSLGLGTSLPLSLAFVVFVPW